MQRGPGRIAWRVGGFRDVRGRREPDRTAPDTISRRGVFVRLVENVAPARAADGHRELPHATAKKSNSPQLWLTTMWHVGTGLPWDWRIGPADSSERAHLVGDAARLCRRKHLIAVGCRLRWLSNTPARSCDSKRHILLRVGSNVRLLKKLGLCPRVGQIRCILWPDREAQTTSNRHSFYGWWWLTTGRHPVYLVTSVLSTTGPDRPAGHRIVCSPLGHRVLLSPFEADVSAAQAPQCPRRERSHRDGMVPDRSVGNGSLCASLANHARGIFHRSG